MEHEKICSKNEKKFEKFCDKVPKIGCIFILESAVILMPMISFCKTNNISGFILDSVYIFCVSVWVSLDSEIYFRWTKNKITSIEAEK